MTTSTPPSEAEAATGDRDRFLRKAVRSLIVYYLEEDIAGGELFKEAWEECRDDRERGVLRDELRAIAYGLQGSER